MNEENMKSISHRRGIFVWPLVTLGLLHAIMPIVLFAQSFGAVISYRKTDHGIEGRTPQGSFVVSVYSEHVVRVQVSRMDQPDNFSYSLVDNAAPRYTGFSVEETGNNKIVLKTASLIVRSNGLLCSERSSRTRKTEF
jgi:hypothetical protein